TVRPDAELGIIIECVDRRLTACARVRAYGIEIPATAHGIAGLRDRDALVKRSHCSVPSKGKVGQDPAVCQRIVNNNWIASSISVTKSSAPSPERVLSERGQQRSSLVINAVRGVDGLDVMVGANRAVGIGRCAGAALPADLR